jgi:hypothetical protein
MPSRKKLNSRFVKCSAILEVIGSDSLQPSREHGVRLVLRVVVPLAVQHMGVHAYGRMCEIEA